MQNPRGDVEIAVALPDGFAAYSNLGSRVAWLKDNLPVPVDED